MNTSFHQDLKEYLDEFVTLVYESTRSFPKEEIFGLTSQLRRASMSVVLNYIEGYARKRKLVLNSFVEISYGSLKESEYLIHFCYKQGFIKDNEKYQRIVYLADTIGKMLWGILEKLK